LRRVVGIEQSRLALAVGLGRLPQWLQFGAAEKVDWSVFVVQVRDDLGGLGTAEGIVAAAEDSVYQHYMMPGS
jgi:hypothetical protein